MNDLMSVGFCPQHHQEVLKDAHPNWDPYVPHGGPQRSHCKVTCKVARIIASPEKPRPPCLLLSLRPRKHVRPERHEDEVLGRAHAGYPATACKLLGSLAHGMGCQYMPELPNPCKILMQ